MHISGGSTGGANGAAAPPKEAVFGGKSGILVEQMGNWVSFGIVYYY